MTAVRHPKISVLGAGEIGSTLAHIICEKNLGDVVLHDDRKDLSKGRALDILHTRPINRSRINILGTSEITDIKDSLVVVVTTEVSESELEEFDEEDVEKVLYLSNGKLMKDVAKCIKKHCPQAFVVVTTNPVDCMCRILQEHGNLPAHKICGMTGVLHSARFRHNLAEKLRVNPGDVQGFVIGAHGDKMVPLPRYCCVNGIPLHDFIQKGAITEKEIDQIVKKTRNTGLELLELLQEGSACYAPSVAITEIIEAYLKDLKRVLVCSVALGGQYGYKGTYASVPVVVGGKGIEKIIELDLTTEEKETFKDSLGHINDLFDNYKRQIVEDEDSKRGASNVP